MKLSKISRQIKKHITGVFVSGGAGRIYNVLSFNGYMRSKQKHMKSLGIKIEGALRFVAADAYFDGHDYSLIQIGDDVTISREVMILTHDYSLGAACRSMGISIHEGEKETPHMTGMVSIGAHTFVGARASLLPETHIGQGCIIGACAVIKGNIPDYSIVVGNPREIVGDVREWTKKKLQKDW